MYPATVVTTHWNNQLEIQLEIQLENRDDNAVMKFCVSACCSLS
uniref:Uncharacterized protein n=1 Tax=Arundo donax TaxID=35708 RepID=A0A0A9HD73_ARUDO